MDTGLDSLNMVSKKVIHKAGEFLGNKIADAVTKSSDNKIVKQEPVEEIILPPEEWFIWFCDKKMDQSKWFFERSIFC